MAGDLRAFIDRKYLSLESYRRDGRPVRTPLWFVEMEGQLYVRTPAVTGKIKRIRRNPRVRIAPSDIRGRPKGEWVDARARIVDAGEEASRANRLLLRKYGLLRRLIDFQVWLRGMGRVGHTVIAIELAGE